MELPIFPLNAVLFPGAAMPLHIFEERYKLMMGECLRERRPFGVALIRQGREVGEPAEPLDVGTIAQIAAVERLQRTVEADLLDRARRAGALPGWLR